MAGRFWREAASLIIVGRSTLANNQVKPRQETDYNLLFLKRSQKSSFMPNAFVFPGGVTEKSDFSPAWLDVFKKCGYTLDDLITQFRHDVPLPEFYTNKPPDMLLPEVGFRITAIRETFEECGLLLASNIPNHIQDNIDLIKWSKAVHKDPSKFLSLFCEFGGCPAVWDLHEWSGWLTPADIVKRFDTAFYITFMDGIPKVQADKKEISELQVASPPHILEQGLIGSLWLPPPQIYEVSRFLHFQLYDKLQEFAVSRGNKGLERWCPFRVIADDGLLSILPGDDLYPDDYDSTKEREKVVLTSSMEELRENAKCLNRLEFKSIYNVNIVVNITSQFGQILPLNYQDINNCPKL